MGSRGNNKKAGLKLTIAIVAVTNGANLPAAIAANAERSAVLEEITVTAQRREQSLQSVPIAVTALSADNIERRQIVDAKQVVFNVPNLTGNSNVGQQTATTFFLRGVGTTESLATVDTTVAVYVDDVYVARQGVNNFNLFDIERIEVLRGPQGTLYGRNATGGAVKIINKQPSAETELNLDAAYRNFDRYRIKVAGNTALLEDRLFFRGAVLTEQGDGYTKNVTLNKEVNDLDYQGARGALRYVFSDAADITFSADWSRDRQNGLYGSDIGNVSRPSTDDLFRVLSGEDIDNTAETYGASISFDWSINNTWNFAAITGSRKTSQKYNLDISDQPVPIFQLSTDTESTQYSQEFKFSGQVNERTNITAGTYFFYEQSDVFLQDDFAPPRDGPRQPVLISDRFYDVTTESYALYAQVDYGLTGNLTAIIGGRYTVDEKSIETNQIINGAQGFNDATLEEQGVDLNPDFDEFTPKLGLDYVFNDNLNAYVSYTRGFRSGGWQARVNNAAQFLNFPAEIVDSLEAGTKATLFGGKMVWNLAAFMTDYSDLFNSVPGADNTFLVATADAEIIGLESELTYRATAWLDVFANLGILETQYEDLTPAVDAQLGEELQRAPALQAKVGFSVDYPLRGGDLLINADAFYTDDYYTNPQNGPFAETGGFALINASLGYRFGGGKYTVSVNCRNCFDKEYFDSILSFPASGFVMVYPGAPRFYELALSARL
ncbi:TonB-dependent receptor [Exilibacterium tricleocarpae]|uniref:TonB-dependent receptor n=1 Tax=Exilibacterium tricleocarpae TaxID=2591008 RepID=A0A545U9P8_9GAMM|nr:TonB-dependent receptor [Exilibacterium tricleocarpae]TQV86197.1 TonB-dependent receptor [Exilibacterium tricleocarpae]